MLIFLKYSPIAIWLKWIVRTNILYKRFPTVKIGYNAIVKDCRLGEYVRLSPNSKIIGSSLGKYSYHYCPVKVD